ncbi:MAG: aspartate carbamoyltransferase catalytic subunit [Deltaproteobacteria bacterium]|nr:aspartate carbamoyltransferase catalytic subunit [Deltaproteobacteria bacterium]
MKKRDFISISDLANDEIEEIFRLADRMLDRAGPEAKFCAGKIMATLFYEPSTRTRLSFESAMQRLGGSVISCPDMRFSSTAKGETIADTARVVASYADILTVRHNWDGAVKAMAKYADVPVINAGDGSHEHPSQTLCDLYTLRKEKGKLKGMTVVLCGDLKHGRTVHSLLYALARFGAHVVTLGARGMEIPQYVVEKLEREYHYSLAPMASDDLQAVVSESDAVYLTPSQPHQLALFTQVDPEMQSRLKNLASRLKFDALYMTRKQKERLKEGGEGEGREYPRIGERFLRERRFKDTVVLHPLPRVDELSPEVDKDWRGIYFKQAAYGVPVRMALLKFLFDALESRKAVGKHKTVNLFKSPEPIGPQCLNHNCVTRTEPVSAEPRFEALFAGGGGGFVLRCCYCDHQLKVQYVGHTRPKRYCSYDSSLLEAVQRWLMQGELAIFDSLKQAEELGYEPYKVGPQRIIMDEADIRRSIEQISDQILAGTGERDRPLILGVRSKGAVLAGRIAEQLKVRRNRDFELGEIEIYGTEEEIKRVPASISETEREPINLKDRAVILVDDVIHTGRTIKSALSIIFKSGRPRSVRLAVLVDRGHREVPVKPDYVGKHIPSSDRERVRVKLREIEQDEKDKVLIYSVIGPDGGQPPPDLTAEATVS